jgi:outer membrane receptor protein involved in Fe transport
LGHAFQNGAWACRGRAHAFPRAACIGLALALVFPRGATGEEPAPDAADITRSVPPVVVRDLRPEDLPDDPSAFSTVIELDQYQGEAKTVEDLLSQAVGVQVRRFGGPGQPSEVSIRGSTANQVVILLDGIRIDTAQSGTVDLSTIPVDLLQRIEVSRGGGAIQQGSGAIGGVINFVTRRPEAEPRTVLTGALASFGTGQGSALHARRLGEWELTTAYEGFTTRGDWQFQRAVTQFGDTVIVPDPPTLTRINNQSEYHSGLVRIGRDLGEKLHLSLQDTGFYNSRGTPGLDSGSGAFGGQQPDAHQRLARNVADLSLVGADLGPLELDSTAHLYHRYQRLHFKNPMPTFGPPLDADQTNTTLGGRFDLERGLSFFGTEHRGTLAFEGYDDRLEAVAFGDPTRLTLDAYAQDDVRAFDGFLRLIPGVRYDHTEGFDDRFVPRIGAVIEPWSWLHVKGNLERSYRVPSFDELYFPDQGFLRGNPGLEPEEAVNWDAGLALAFAGPWPVDRVTLEGAYFETDIDDSIVFVLISPFTVAPVNTGPATSRGVEVSASLGLLRWITLSANYTYLDARLDDSDTPLPGRSPNEFSGRVQLGPPSGLFKMFADALYTDVIPVSESGNTVLPARTVYDAGVVLDLVKVPVLGERIPMRSLLLSFIASNLTDVSVRDALFFPQPGRVLSIKAECTW